MSKLTPAQHECRMARWQYLREATDLGRRFKRTGQTHTGDDLGQQTVDALDQSRRDVDFARLKNAVNGAHAAGVPRLTFARAFFAAVDATASDL